MTAFRVLRAAYAAGLTVRADGDALRVTGTTAARPLAAMQRLKDHKGAVLALLSEQGIGQHDDYPSPLRGAARLHRAWRVPSPRTM